MPEEKPQKLWMKNGRLLVNSDGQPVLSDHCCCESDSSQCCCPVTEKVFLLTCTDSGDWGNSLLFSSTGKHGRSKAQHAYWSGRQSTPCRQGGSPPCPAGDHMLASKYNNNWEYSGSDIGDFVFCLPKDQCGALTHNVSSRTLARCNDIQIAVPKDCPCHCEHEDVDLSISLPHLKAYAVMYNVTAWQPLATEPPDQVWYWGDEPNDENLEPVAVKEVRVLPHWQVASYLADNSMCTATLRCTRSFPVSYHDFVIGGMERPQSFCQVVDGNPVVTTSDYSDNYASNEVDLAGGSRFYDGFPLQPRPDWTTQDGRMMSVWSADWMDGAGLYSRVDDGWGIYDELVKTALRAEWTGEEITGTTKNRVRVVQPLMVRRDNQMTAHSFVFGSDQWGVADAALYLAVKYHRYTVDCSSGAAVKDVRYMNSWAAAVFIREARGASRAMQNVDIKTMEGERMTGNPCWLYRDYLVTDCVQNNKLPVGNPFSIASAAAPELWNDTSDFPPARVYVKGVLDFCPQYAYTATVYRYASCTLDGDDSVAGAIATETGINPVQITAGGNVGLQAPGFAYSQYLALVNKDGEYHTNSYLHLDEEDDGKSFRAYNQLTDGYCVSFVKLDIHNYPTWYHGDCANDLNPGQGMVPALTVDEPEWYMHEWGEDYANYPRCHYWPNTPACRVQSSTNPCGFVPLYSSRGQVFPRFYSVTAYSSTFPYGVDPDHACLRTGTSWTVVRNGGTPNVFPGIYDNVFAVGAYVGDQMIALYDVSHTCSSDVWIRNESAATGGEIAITSQVSSSWKDDNAMVSAANRSFCLNDLQGYWMRDRTTWFGHIPDPRSWAETEPQDWDERMRQSNLNYVSFFDDVDATTKVHNQQTYSVFAWPAMACEAAQIGGMGSAVWQGQRLPWEFAEELFAAPDPTYICGNSNRMPKCLECRDLDQYPDWLQDLPDGTVQHISRFMSVGLSYSMRIDRDNGWLAGFSAAVNSSVSSDESFTITRDQEDPGGWIPDAEPHQVNMSMRLPVTYYTSKKGEADATQVKQWELNLGDIGMKVVRCGSEWKMAPQDPRDNVVLGPPAAAGIVCDARTGLTYAFDPPAALPTIYTRCIPGTINLERGSNWYRLTRTVTMQVNAACIHAEGTGNYCGKIMNKDVHTQTTTMNASWGYAVSFTFPQGAGDPGCAGEEEDQEET